MLNEEAIIKLKAFVARVGHIHTATSDKFYFKMCIFFIFKWAVNLEAAVWLSFLRDGNTTCIIALWELFYLRRVYRKEMGDRIINVLLYCAVQAVLRAGLLTDYY